MGKAEKQKKEKKPEKRRIRASSKNLKKKFLRAFELLNGVDGLVQWARESNDNITEFYKIIGKMLPKVVEDATDINNKNKLILDPDREAVLREAADKIIQLRLVKPGTTENVARFNGGSKEVETIQ